MKGIKEFKSFYKESKSFDFDDEKQIIHFSNSQSKKDKLLFSLFIASFIIIMLQIANWKNFSFSFLIYSILIGAFISFFSLVGKNEFIVDLKNQVFTRKSLLRKRKLIFSEIKDIQIVKSYLNFTFINYRIDFITKQGKTNYVFLGERDKNKAEEILKWSKEFIQLN